MKKLLFIILYLSFGTFAYADDVMTTIKACNTYERVKICSIVEESNLAFSVETTLGLILVESNKDYEAVDSQKLRSGLEKISKVGVSPQLVAYIHGPVQSDIKYVIEGGDMTLEEVVRNLALKISRIK